MMIPESDISEECLLDNVPPPLSTAAAAAAAAAATRTNKAPASSNETEEIPPHVQALLSKLGNSFRGLVVVATTAYLIGVFAMVGGMRISGFKSSIIYWNDAYQVRYTPSFASIPGILVLVWGIGLLASCILLIRVVPLTFRLCKESEPARTLLRHLVLKASWQDQSGSSPNTKDSISLQDAMYEDWMEIVAALTCRGPRINQDSSPEQTSLLSIELEGMNA